jgi:phosphoesterase RecJ-like protein
MNVKQVANIFQERDNFLIITHQRPDGDAIGSTLGLLEALRENGKKADAFFHEELPCAYLELISTPYLIEKLPCLGDYDNIICLDFSNPKRFGDVDLSAFNTINIDHHPDNSRFGKDNFIYPRAAATAEIIFNIVNSIKTWNINIKAATYMLMGVIMDTGGLRFDNTSASVLTCAAELLKAGAEHSRIVNSLFYSKPKNIAEMEADIVLHHLQSEFNGKFAWFYMSDELLDSYGVSEKDTEGLIDVLRELKGVEIAAIFRKKDEGFRFSLRSKNKKYSVGAIARALNGGGHELAAGGFIQTAYIDEAEKIMMDYVKNEFSKDRMSI